MSKRAIEEATPGADPEATRILRFMERGRVRGVPGRDLSEAEAAQFSPTQLGEMIRPRPDGLALYEWSEVNR